MLGFGGSGDGIHKGSGGLFEVSHDLFGPVISEQARAWGCVAS